MGMIFLPPHTLTMFIISYGQLGLLHTRDNATTPQLVESLAEFVIRDFCTGGFHCTILLQDLSVYSWGRNVRMFENNNFIFFYNLYNLVC